MVDPILIPIVVPSVLATMVVGIVAIVQIKEYKLKKEQIKAETMIKTEEINARNRLEIEQLFYRNQKKDVGSDAIEVEDKIDRERRIKDISG